MPNNKDDGFKHQDWEPVVLRKTPQQLKDMSKGNVNKSITNKNYKPNSNNLTTVSKNLLNDDLDHFEIKTVSRSLSVQIQQARNLKKMTQKDLANKLNTQPSVIQSYENGKAVPNGEFLAKMSKILGVKLKK